jgi:hypothetical protein
LNPKAADFANYDESKASPYPVLPDPLGLRHGRKVTTPGEWWNLRRPEIVEEFDREIYGRMPGTTPAVNWETVSIETNSALFVVTKQLIGHVDNSAYPPVAVDIELKLVTPLNVAKPTPVVMEFAFNFPGRAGRTNLQGSTNRFPIGSGGPGVVGPSWQQQVLARGWSCAVYTPTSVQADNGAGLTKGIIGLCNRGQPRTLDDWGALRAWAWGASRALDYLATDKSVDAKRVAIEGHSRYGKACLVAMAYDPRFAAAFVSSSGEGGAKLHRRNWGELVENVAASGEYHWMAGNFLKYAGPLTWNDLPVDSHELIALCAPRPVFISAGSTNGDAWVDAKGMFLAAVGAEPVYTLLGKKGMATGEFPPIETALVSSELAFRQHSSGHTPGPNWPIFLDWVARYFSASEAAPQQSPIYSRALPPPRRATVPKLHGKVKLDGQFNEKEWDSAARLEPFYKNDGSGAEREHTLVRLWYDNQALYLGWTCQDMDIQATMTNRDSKFWEEEVVEFFVAPRSLDRYFELQWNPLGGIFDAIITNTLDAKGVSKSFQGDWSYTAKGMHCVVKLKGKLNGSSDKDEYWAVEVRLPFSDLGLNAPKPGEVWRANFYRFNRTKGLPVEQLSWSPTMLPGFHQPSRFGYLEFAR